MVCIVIMLSLIHILTIREDDKVIEVRMTNGDNEIIIANRDVYKRQRYGC